MLSSDNVLHIDFANPAYARQFVALNRGIARLKYNERRLNAAASRAAL